MDSYSVVTSGLQAGETRGMRCRDCRSLGEAVWCPGCSPAEPEGQRSETAKHERSWLARRAAELDEQEQRRRRPTAWKGRVSEATKNYATSAATAAAAMLSASATAPPQQRGEKIGRGSGPADQPAAQTTAMIEAVNDAMTAYGHLLSDCLHCGDTLEDFYEEGVLIKPVRHNEPDTDTLATILDADWGELADSLTGLSATSPHAAEKHLREAVTLHTSGAVEMAELWQQLWRDGAEADVLADLGNRIEQLAHRMDRLAGLMDCWRPGVLVRLCACGCGAHAPTGRRLTDACEKRKQRAG